MRILQREKIYVPTFNDRTPQVSVLTPRRHVLSKPHSFAAII